MRTIVFKAFKFSLLLQIFITTQLFAQLDKDYPSKIKKRYLFGIYNQESARDLNSTLTLQAKLLNTYIILKKKQIEDSLNFYLTDKSTINQHWYLNFTNGLKWKLPDSLPKYPDILEHYIHSKDDSILNEPEVINWIFYMQVLDYWKKNKKLPNEVTHSYVYIDTLEFENNIKFRLLSEQQYNKDSLTSIHTILTPLK